ncbi:MAG: hypothetical protein RR397_03480 [Odoribacter sp.]
MDFTLLDKETESTFQEIIRRIHRLQSGGTIDSLREIGANIEKQIGASYVSLKNLAAAYEPNEALAFLLWNEQRREEQIIACFLLPSTINKEKITQLILSCLNFEIAGYFGSLYLYRSLHLSTTANEWLDSNIPFLQLATLSALTRYLILNKEENPIFRDLFQKAVDRKYEDKYVQMVAKRYRFNI